MKPLLFLLPSLLFAQVNYFGIEIPNKYYDELISLCTEYKIPAQYVARLFKWESNWDDQHININKDGTKDFGLGQHYEKAIPDLIRWHNDNITYNPLYWKDNMRISIKHLAYLRIKTGSWFGAIAAYNMGLNGFIEWRLNKRLMPESTKKEIEFIFG